MKIAILTVPFNNNYGGFLQAFALKNIIESYGHEVFFIDRRRNRKGYKIVRIIKHILFLDKSQRKQKKISVNTLKFQRTYLRPKTRTYYTSKSLKQCLEYKFDLYIVGSDQVWRYKFAKENIDDYFFNFLKGTSVPRISYAASFGISSSEYDNEKKLLCTSLLKEFKCISVREESAKKILHEEFQIPNKAIKTVLDPTLLLNVDTYISLVNQYEKPEREYIFSYILDTTAEINNSTHLLSDRMNLPVIKLKAQTGDKKTWDIIEPVELWLNRIYYSKFVITDSFHGMVFSIIFKKPFIVYANHTRGLDRFTSLLSILGLSDRLVTTPKEFSLTQIQSQDINWHEVEKHLSKYKEESLNFLTNSLTK